MKSCKKCLLLVMLYLIPLLWSGFVKAQTSTLSPFVGAQVYIEPGQTPEKIDEYFHILKENNFTVCRVRLIEYYMHKADGKWDFTLFDQAFKAAEKYKIKVFADIFPIYEKTNLGGVKCPMNEAHLKSIAECIKNMTLHFSQFSSLYAWMLMNEPGIKDIATEFAQNKYKEWKMSHPQRDLSNNGYPVLSDFSLQSFLLYYNTWYLNWIADEIKKYDTKHELHVNPYDLFSKCPLYDFPEWRKFLTIFGGSTHPSWHFGYFSRKQYSVAMSANCEMLRSGAGDIPWMITELQGGNNVYSGNAPFCPTKEEIAQWLWTAFGTEAKGSIFWTLNPTISISEAGEWGLLNYQYKATDRLTAASEVAGTLKKHEELFTRTKEAESGISILYVHESFWAESMKAKGTISDFEARRTGAVMKSVLGYFEAFCEMGVNANLKAFTEYDFSKDNYNGQTIILANQICIPGRYVENLEDFVRKGGKLIMDGITGYYDENIQCTLNTNWPFEKLTGGNISEFKVVDNLFTISIMDINIPAHYMRGFISNSTAKVITSFEGLPIATQNKFGNGEVLWIPSMIGLGSRMQNNYIPLIDLLNKEVKTSLINIPIRFKAAQKNMIMKTLVSGDSYITLIINKTAKNRIVKLSLKNRSLKPEVLFANKQGKVYGKTVTIASEETVVAVWK